MEGNYTIDEMTVLEDIEDIDLIQISHYSCKAFSLSSGLMILESSRDEYYRGDRKW